MHKSFCVNFSSGYTGRSYDRKPANHSGPPPAHPFPISTMSKNASSEEERQRNPVPPYRRPGYSPSVEAAKTINVSRNPNVGEAAAGCKPLFWRGVSALRRREVGRCIGPRDGACQQRKILTGSKFDGTIYSIKMAQKNTL